MPGKVPPEDAVILTWVADVTSAAQGGDWPKAIRWAEHALSMGLQHPRLFHMRSIGHERAGRLTEAMEDLERAHALDLNDVGIANALGVHLTRAGTYARAVQVLQNAVVARPDIAVSHMNLAAAQMFRGDPAAAQASFAKAAELDPSDGKAAGKLALLAAHRGDRAAARTAATEAMARDPMNPDARRALIESNLDELRFVEAQDAARAWLNEPSLGAVAKHHALGLLGDALDGLKRPTEAFDAYQNSNIAFRALHAKRFQHLEALPIRTTLSNMEREFRASSAADWSPAASKAIIDASAPRAHVFLMGFMRSGTTLLEQALSAHDDVVALEETEAMAQAATDFLGMPGGLARLAGLAADEADAYRAAYWIAVRDTGIKPDGKIFIDKLPFNGVKLPLIAKLFPNAKIIFALRDPRDVVFSCFQRRLQPNSYAYELATLDGAAGLYDAYMSLVSQYRAKLDLQILDHRHEALIQDIESALKEVCSHIGLDFTPAMIAFGGAAQAGQVASQTSRQLQGGLTPKGVGRWQKYRTQLAPVLPVLRPWSEAFGYASE